MVPPASPANVTRKTISFPTELHDELLEQARRERRQFSPHVIKILEQFFLPESRHTALKTSTAPSRGL